MSALLYASGKTVEQHKNMNANHVKNVYKCTRCNFWHFGRPSGKNKKAQKQDKQIVKYFNQLQKYVSRRSKKHSTLAKDHETRYNKQYEKNKYKGDIDELGW